MASHNRTVYGNVIGRKDKKGFSLRDCFNEQVRDSAEKPHGDFNGHTWSPSTMYEVSPFRAVENKAFSNDVSLYSAVLDGRLSSEFRCLLINLGVHATHNNRYNGNVVAIMMQSLSNATFSFSKTGDATNLLSTIKWVSHVMKHMKTSGKEWLAIYDLMMTRLEARHTEDTLGQIMLKAIAHVVGIRKTDALDLVQDACTSFMRTHRRCRSLTTEAAADSVFVFFVALRIFSGATLEDVVSKTRVDFLTNAAATPGRSPLHKVVRLFLSMVFPEAEDVSLRTIVGIVSSLIKSGTEVTTAAIRSRVKMSLRLGSITIEKTETVSFYLNDAKRFRKNTMLMPRVDSSESKEDSETQLFEPPHNPRNWGCVAILPGSHDVQVQARFNAGVSGFPGVRVFLAPPDMKGIHHIGDGFSQRGAGIGKGAPRALDEPALDIATFTTMKPILEVNTVAGTVKYASWRSSRSLPVPDGYTASQCLLVIATKACFLRVTKTNISGGSGTGGASDAGTSLADACSVSEHDKFVEAWGSVLS